MLINQSKHAITVRWDGRARTLLPGDMLDVRDLNVKDEHKINVENRLIKKHMGIEREGERPRDNAETKPKVSSAVQTLLDQIEECDAVISDDAVTKEKKDAAVKRKAGLEVALKDVETKQAKKGQGLKSHADTRKSEAEEAKSKK